MAGDGLDPPAPLLGRTSAAAAAGGVPVGGGDGDRDGGRAAAAADPAHLERRALDGVLRLELVLDPQRRHLLLPELPIPALAAAAHVVAGDRGAVLSGVAAGGPRGVEAGAGTAVPVALELGRGRWLVWRGWSCRARRAARRVGSVGGGACGRSARSRCWAVARWCSSRRRPGQPRPRVGTSASPSGPVRRGVLRLVGVRDLDGVPRAERLHDARVLRHGLPRPGAAGRCRDFDRADAVAARGAIAFGSHARPGCWASSAWRARPCCG